MLEKKERYTSIDIKELGQVQLLKVISILDDGVVISEANHRQIRTPDQDISDLPENIQSVINAYWSQEVKDNWNELVRKANEELT